MVGSDLTRLSEPTTVRRGTHERIPTVSAMLNTDAMNLSNDQSAAVTQESAQNPIVAAHR